MFPNQNHWTGDLFVKLTLYLIWTCIDSRLIPNKLLHLKYWFKEDLINNEADSVSNVSFLLSIKLHWYEFIEVSLKGFFNVSQRSRNGWEIEKTSTRDVTLLMKWSLNQGSFSAFFPSNNPIFLIEWSIRKIYWHYDSIRFTHSTGIFSVNEKWTS